MRLLYTGALPVTFMSLGISVSPGDEFEVSDEATTGLLVRADISEVTEEAPPRRRPVKADEAVSEDTPDTASSAGLPTVSEQEETPGS